MKTKELLIYEAPSVTEWIGIKPLQNIISKYIVFKINRKMKRYNKRITMEALIKKYNN